MLTIDQIREMLPHRYPFLLVDRVLEREEGERIVAIKNVTINEPFFQGHYPETPVMPGVLIVEAMAQVGGLIVGGAPGADVIPLLAAIEKVRFREVVKPGDQLVITATVQANRSGLVKISAQAKVAEKIAAQGDLTFVLAPKENK
ncbi:MAG: 3-hydroxyacyl-ACP dehydratase FabZ [Bacillota bacterium]|nr:3-hydroxyacyl-ACP dehydratase FabZ [Bacillota bacterium]HHU60455.1 3-hydroxyacyl-ACP dehydratase FabZ [Natronincola sp.]